MSSEKRWRVILRYHVNSGEVEKECFIEELDELSEIVESGPNWYALKGIVITHVRRPTETRTIEQAMAE